MDGISESWKIESLLLKNYVEANVIINFHKSIKILLIIFLYSKFSKESNVNMYKIK